MTTKTDDIKLLPCPFCGGDAEMDTLQGYLGLGTGRLGNRIAVYCQRCDADMGVCIEDVPDITPEQVAEMWNRRAAVESDRQGRMPSDDELAAMWAEQNEECYMPTILLTRVCRLVRAALSRYGDPHVGQSAASAEPSQITDAMVDAYLKAQADVIRRVDDMWGNGGKAASYLHPVRESCRAGLQAALGGAAPVAQEPAESVLIDGVAYTIPAPVAAELLRLHIELRQGVPVAQEPCPSCGGSGWIGGPSYYEPGEGGRP